MRREEIKSKRKPRLAGKSLILFLKLRQVQKGKDFMKNSGTRF